MKQNPSLSKAQQKSSKRGPKAYPEPSPMAPASVTSPDAVPSAGTAPAEAPPTSPSSPPPTSAIMESKSGFSATLATTLLSVMAVILSVCGVLICLAQMKLAKVQSDIAQAQVSRSSQEPLIQKSPAWADLANAASRINSLCTQETDSGAPVNSSDEKWNSWCDTISKELDSQANNPELVADTTAFNCWREAISIAKASRDKSSDSAQNMKDRIVSVDAIQTSLAKVWERVVLRSKQPAAAQILHGVE